MNSKVTIKKTEIKSVNIPDSYYFSKKTTKSKFIFTSLLYIAAPLFQSVWIYILIKHSDQVKNWASIPVIGWVMMFLFLAMTLIVPYLFIIGFFLLRKIIKATNIISTHEENRKRKMVNMLLLVGIFADIVFGWMLLSFEIKDTSAIVFACALFGGKILQANMEAIFMYHKM